MSQRRRQSSSNSSPFHSFKETHRSVILIGTLREQPLKVHTITVQHLHHQHFAWHCASGAAASANWQQQQQCWHSSSPSSTTRLIGAQSLLATWRHLGATERPFDAFQRASRGIQSCHQRASNSSKKRKNENREPRNGLFAAAAATEDLSFVVVPLLIFAPLSESVNYF